MHKAHPNDAKLCLAFGRRCHLALALRGATEQSRVSQADVMRGVEAMTGQRFSDATVSRWFGGMFWPQEPTVMLALAKVLQVDVGWLYFGDYSSAEGPELDTVAALINPRRKS